MTDDHTYGYLLVHVVEDAHGHAEKIFLSLSLGDDPLRWRRLNGGAPVLEPQGFHALTTRHPAGGDWTPVPDEDFHIPPLTKHGSVLALTRTEWERLDEL